jgi:outer membrane immunogenic protein
MKMFIAAAAAAAAAAAFAAPAMAQTALGPVSGYGDIGYAYAHDDPVNLSAVQGRLGARTTYLGVEGQGAFGIGSDTDSGVKIKLRSEYSGYAIGFLPLGQSGAELFARVGYGHSSFKANNGTVSITDGQDSVNYGAGVQYFINHGPNGVRADYTRYDFTGHGNGSGDVFSISYVRKFGGQ